MKVAAKIKKCRTSRQPKLSQHELASLIGVSRSAYAQYEAGNNHPPIQVVKRLASLWDLPLDWFFDGVDSPIPMSAYGSPAPGFSPPGPGGGYAHEKVGRRLFPLMGRAGAAAFPIESESSEEEDYVEFSDDLFLRNSSQFAISVWGDSMEPRFSHGDFILVTLDPDFRAAGRCVVVRDPDGRYLVKGLGRSGEEWILVPSNETYEKIAIGTPGWEMVGYATGWRRDRGKGSYIEEGDRSGLRCE